MTSFYKKRNWIEQYWKLMVAENFEVAIPLKGQHFPKSFFKYRVLNDKTIDSLKDNYFWLAEISSLNDPFECSIQFDNDECLRHFYSSETFKNTFKERTREELTRKEIKRLSNSQKPYEEYLKICTSKNIQIDISAEQQLKNIESRWVDIVEETNKELRICSFSTINSSLLLWSHYANDHKGICIEYDFENEDEIRTFIQPVYYQNKVFKIKLLDDFSMMKKIGSSLIKSKEWEYEQEWRLTIFKQKEKFPQKMLAPKPKAIYLGTRFKQNEQDLKEKLLKIATENEIPLYQMIKHSHEFKLIKK